MIMDYVCNVPNRPAAYVIINLLSPVVLFANIFFLVFGKVEYIL